MNKCQLLITRASHLSGSAKTYSVEIDGIFIGKLKNGGSISTHVSQGQHSISFVSFGRTEKSISIFIDQDCPATNIFADLNKWGKIVLTLDGPHPSDGGAPYSGPQSKKRKHPALKVVAIVFCALIVIGVISFIGTDSSSGDRAQSSSSAVLTDEDKAQAKLDEAAEEFQSGDYMSAIGICDKIVADYPGTRVADGMGVYLDEQFAQYPHYSADELMGEYEANVVKADETYSNTVMVVSGTVSSIGKTNGDSNLTVLLKSGSYFHSVQLNFKKSQTDAIAALNVGDSIEVVGKCTGQSGKVLLFIDGDNVMIENCYIIP